MRMKWISLPLAWAVAAGNWSLRVPAQDGRLTAVFHARALAVGRERRWTSGYLLDERS